MDHSGREVGPLIPVDAPVVEGWLEASLAALGEERGYIDSLNVFPVPDGDTGTNMFLTLESACASVQQACEEAESGGGAPPSLADVAAALSYGALLGARGNSGVILAQILRGVAAVLGDVPAGSAFDAPLVRTALRRAATDAYAAVAEPVEGTILTVARAAADGAEAHPGDDVVGVIRSATEAAEAALERTPDQLAVLREAGVVAAGGQGLVVVYGALLDIVTGVRRWRSPRARGRAGQAGDRRRTGPRGDAGRAAAGSASYEVMFLIEADADAMASLRAGLEPLGDSLVVTGAPPLWSVHVHVDDAGAAIEEALVVGRPQRIRVTYLPTSPPPVEPVSATSVSRGLVAVSHGPGVSALLEEQGVTTVAARPRRRPSTADLLDGVARSGSTEVVLLPSDSDTLAVAEAAAEEARRAGVRISVIPTRSIVQTLAAVAVHDPLARFDDDVVAMSRASGATHYGAITVASREAFTSAGPCRPGDVLGLADGDIVEVGTSEPDVARAILGRMLSTGGELITVIAGEGADPGWLEQLEEWVSLHHPGVDWVLIDGGQALWPVILGVE
ncbi:MAG: DAK2 domain-containing protein [bacterium]